MKLTNVATMKKERERGLRNRESRLEYHRLMKARQRHKHSIYIIQHPDHPDCLKIGKSNHIRLTVSGLNKGDPFKRFAAAVLYPIGDSHDEAMEIEKHIHYALDHCRLVGRKKGEWFRMTVEEAKSAIEAHIRGVKGYVEAHRQDASGNLVGAV